MRETVILIVSGTPGIVIKWSVEAHEDLEIRE